MLRLFLTSAIALLFLASPGFAQRDGSGSPGEGRDGGENIGDPGSIGDGSGSSNDDRSEIGGDRSSFDDLQDRIDGAAGQVHEHQSPGSRGEAERDLVERHGAAALSVHVGEISSHTDELRRIQGELGNIAHKAGSANVDAAGISRLQAAVYQMVTRLDALTSLIDEAPAEKVDNISRNHSEDIEKIDKTSGSIIYYMSTILQSILNGGENISIIEAKIMDNISQIEAVIDEIKADINCCSAQE